MDFECWYIRTHEKPSKISKITFAILPLLSEKQNTQTEWSS